MASIPQYIHNVIAALVPSPLQLSARTKTSKNGRQRRLHITSRCLPHAHTYIQLTPCTACVPRAIIIWGDNTVYIMKLSIVCKKVSSWDYCTGYGGG